jgi:hypothetical protein
MIELPFDPYDSPPAPSHRREPLPANSSQDDSLAIMRRQLQAWFFGWAFYCFGVMIFLAVAIHAFTDVADSDTFVFGLFIFCGWMGAFLQYRFPIGGPRGALSRAEKRQAALGSNYKIGKVLLAVGVIVGTSAVMLNYFLENTVKDGGTVGLIVLVAGQALAGGCIFLGRRMMNKAERAAAVSQPAQNPKFRTEP